LHVHARLDAHLAIRLHHAFRHALGHLGGRVADVDLAAGDVERASVERDGLGDAAHGVLGRGVGNGHRARRMRGDGAVVDDAPAARSASAEALPMPALAPVTSATLCVGVAAIASSVFLGRGDYWMVVSTRFMVATISSSCASSMMSAGASAMMSPVWRTSTPC